MTFNNKTFVFFWTDGRTDGRTGTAVAYDTKLCYFVPTVALRGRQDCVDGDSVEHGGAVEDAL